MVGDGARGTGGRGEGVVVVVLRKDLLQANWFSSRLRDHFQYLYQILN